MKKLVLWAINPFETPGALLENAARTLRALVTETGADVEPVFVLSPAQLNLSLEFHEPWVDRYLPAAGKALSHAANALGVPGLLPARVISDSFASTGQAVQALSDHAVKAGAELIVSCTHGRTGMRRVFLGSFTETLLLRSRVPVLVVGPRMTRRPRLKSILYPTDLSDVPETKSAFYRMIELARWMRSRVTLFHVIPHPIEPIFQSGVDMLGGAWVPVQEYFSQEMERRTRIGEAWADLARAQGVEAAVRVDSSPGSIADKILAAADLTGAGVIAMEAETGPIAAALIGSITRQVLRQARIPVWTIRGRLVLDEGLRHAA